MSPHGRPAEAQFLDRQSVVTDEEAEIWTIRRDLLRQRRARRDAGQDPETTDLRSAQVVERYEQYPDCRADASEATGAGLVRVKVPTDEVLLQ